MCSNNIFIAQNISVALVLSFVFVWRWRHVSRFTAFVRFLTSWLRFTPEEAVRGLSVEVT